MFKTETHLHTLEGSACGLIRAAEMVRRYHKAGYSTLFITDHFAPKFFKSLGEELTWEEKVTVFFSSYHRAKAEGDKLGVHVLPGAEIGLSTGPNHYLLYGADVDFYKGHPYFFNMPIEEIHALVRREPNAMLMQAHPHRDGKCYPTPEFVDGMEVCNTNPCHEDFSHRSLLVAQEWNLPISGGSDAHGPEEVARGGILTETEITSADDLIRLIKERKVVPIGGEKTVR